MKNTKISLIILLIISSFSVSAQENTRWLSLQDVIEIAKKQSPDALMAKHRFRSSFWEYKTFKADYLPSLQFNGILPNINRSIDPEKDDGVIVYKENKKAYFNAFEKARDGRKKKYYQFMLEQTDKSYNYLVKLLNKY